MMLKRTSRTICIALASACCVLCVNGYAVTQRSAARAADEYVTLRAKCREMLTGGARLDVADSAVRRRVGAIEEQAQARRAAMERSPARKYLWADLADATDVRHTQQSYERLRSMALAYRTKGAGSENDAGLRGDIIAGLEWLDANRYNTTTSKGGASGLWWVYEIGIPLALNDLTVLMYDDLTAEQRGRYMAAVLHFNPDFNVYGGGGSATGANLVWKRTNQIVRGVILGDAGEIAAGRDGLSDVRGGGKVSVFRYVEDGDGFHEDGSFIQHDRFAYTGGYGVSLLGNLADVMYLLSGSRWQVTDPAGANVFRRARESYEPLLYKGAMMDMARGREASRQAVQDHVAGHRTLQGLLRLAQFAPPAEAARLKRTIKYHILADTYRDFFLYAPPNFITLARAVVADKSIVPQDEQAMHKTFAAMDRVVHRRPGFAFGISMSSNRIFNYESINNENLRGWYTGDGMTYLYDGDLAQFSEDFWATVDAQRLPGTTVDTRRREPVSVGWREEYLSPKSWAGGASAGGYGVAGMELDAYGSSLVARKSWFMFDDEIVCLGSGITSTDARPVETIIENRRLSGDGELLVGGAPSLVPAPFGETQTLTRSLWAHLTNGSSSIGYFFPAESPLKVLRDRRTDSWKSINKSFSTDEKFTRDFLTIWFDHGARPAGATYVYALLPNKTTDQTLAYAGAPDVLVLENSAAAQAVRERKLNLLGINFWEDRSKAVDIVTCDRKASVMLREADGRLEVAVSDPTQENTGVINLEVRRAGLRLVNADERVKTEATEAGVRLSINVGGARGRTLTARFAVTDKRRS